MTYYVDQMHRDFTAECAGWGAGADDLPTDDGSPKSFELNALFREGEGVVMEMAPPKFKQVAGTITTIAGTAFKSDLTDVWDRQFLNIELTGTSVTSSAMDYIDYNQARRRWPDMENTTPDRGVPRYLTVRPSDGYIGILGANGEAPDAVYTIKVVYQRAPPPMALPARGNFWIDFQQFGPGDIAIVGDDDRWAHTFVDARRGVALYVPAQDRDESTENKFYLTVKVAGVSVVVEFDVPVGDAIAIVPGMNPATPEDEMTFEEIVSLEADENNPDTITLALGCTATFYDTTTVTSSMFPDFWAPRMAPVYAAMRWYERQGDMKRAGDKFAIFNRAAKSYIKHIFHGAPLQGHTTLPLVPGGRRNFRPALEIRP